MSPEERSRKSFQNCVEFLRDPETEAPILEEIRDTLDELFQESYISKEQYEKLPSVTPNVHTNTGPEEVQLRRVALESLGYEPLIPIENVSVLQRVNGVWKYINTVSPEARSEIITAFAVYNLIYMMIGLNQGFVEEYRLDPDGLKRHVVTDLELEKIQLWQNKDEILDTFLMSLLQNRLDTTGWAQTITTSRGSMKLDVMARRMGRKVNTDGEVTLNELAKISKKVLEAFKFWKSKTEGK